MVSTPTSVRSRAAVATARGSAAALLAAAAVAAAVLLPGAAGATGRRAHRAVAPHALLGSRLLWATIDVCSASDQPDTLGIRGSMPGDREAHDTMYMRFRLQYMNTKTNAWTDLAHGISPTWTNVGSGASARQGGRSFQLSPTAGQPAVTMRGVVAFQWRDGATVLAQTSRTTSAGRSSLAGADPPGFSAATCSIGG